MLKYHLWRFSLRFRRFEAGDELRDPEGTLYRAVKPVPREDCNALVELDNGLQATPTGAPGEYRIVDTNDHT